jgi:hypothetical protein
VILLTTCVDVYCDESSQAPACQARQVPPNQPRQLAQLLHIDLHAHAFGDVWVLRGLVV